MASGYARRGGRAPVPDVYVARTIEVPQQPFESFLNAMGRRVGRVAGIQTITSTHITFLESSRSVRQLFQSRGFTPGDVRHFSGDLHRYLETGAHMQASVVEIDSERPLVWTGVGADKLALNVKRSDELAEQRECIVDFLRDRFGKVPALREFDPHITVGSAEDLKMIKPEYRKDPSLLVPPRATIPEQITLNGLMVYLDNISDDRL